MCSYTISLINRIITRVFPGKQEKAGCLGDQDQKVIEVRKVLWDQEGTTEKPDLLDHPGRRETLEVLVIRVNRDFLGRRE